MDPGITITTTCASDHDALLDLWEASVRATHDFMPGDYIDYLKPLVREHMFSTLALRVARDSRGCLLGFVGMKSGSVEALFVAPDVLGQGIGRLLLEHAESEFATTRLDCNEQNEQALGFYRHLGYEIASRSPLDGQGRPYPILHLHKTR